MRRTAKPVAILATAGLLLAGCNGVDSNGGEPEAEAPEVEEADDTGAEEEAPAADGSLLIWVDENRQPAVESAASSFTDETGIEVELVVKNFEDIRADFLAQVPTGEGPDITVGAHDWLGSFIVNGVVDSVDLAGNEAAFEDVAIEGFTYDGQLYGLPYASEAIALIRNTELAPDPVPDDFDEMIEVGRDIGTNYPFVINTAGADGDAYNYYAMQTSFGAPVFEQNPDGSYTTEVGMGGDGGYAFAEWLGERSDEGVFSTDWTYDIAVQEFADGNAPFTINGPWAIADFTDAGVDVAVDPIPSAGGETAAPFVGVQGFYVSAQSDNALIANDFLVNFMATPEAMMALHEADPRIPAYTEVAEQVAEDEVIAGFLASSQNGAPMPSIPEMAEMWDHWNAAQASIISGSEDAEVAWERMLTNLEETLG